NGTIWAEYNDGVLRVGRRILAHATASNDQDVHPNRGIEGPDLTDLNDWTRRWKDVLVPEVLDMDDGEPDEDDPDAKFHDFSPDFDLVLKHLSEGRSILKPR